MPSEKGECSFGLLGANIDVGEGVAPLVSQVLAEDAWLFLVE